MQTRLSGEGFSEKNMFPRVVVGVRRKHIAGGQPRIRGGLKVRERLSPLLRDPLICFLANQAVQCSTVRCLTEVSQAAFVIGEGNAVSLTSPPSAFSIHPNC